MVIEFHLDAHSGVAPYLQVIHQVRQALRPDLLSEGDQLPTVKDVVGRLAINPNTVLKAYRELEYEGLVAARPGLGTFVTRTLGDGSPATIAPLRRELQRWLAKARRTGLDDESIEALMLTTFRSATEGEGDIAGRPSSKRRGWAGDTAAGGRYPTARWTSPPGRWSGWSAPTARARPRCCISPPACCSRPRALSRCLATARR